MTEPLVFHPVKRIFVWRPVMYTALFALVVAVGGSMIAMGLEELSVFVPLMILAVPIYTAIDRIVAFSKTSYEIHSDRLVHHTGDLFTNKTTNLPFRNVTQLGLTLPFLEHRFFQTGHVAVHAAGSSGPVKLVSIADSQGIYQALEQALRDNGFVITRRKIVQEEKPGFIGVLVDQGSQGLVAIFVVLSLAGQAGVALAALDSPMAFVGIAFLAATGALTYFVILVLGFIDKLKRVYTLWDDMIEYQDGFLTERRKIIPFENLADTNVVEPLLKRIFGLADVVLSCQGQAGDIRFPSMPNPKMFRGNLDQLLEDVEPPKPPTPSQAEGTLESGEVFGVDGADGVDGAARVAAATGDLGTSQPARTYRIHPFRHALPNLLWVPVLVIATPIALVVDSMFDGELLGGTAGLALTGFLFLIALISTIAVGGRAAFHYLTTTFTFGPRSISMVREVITNRQATEFTNDKVTAVTFHRGLLDRWMNTASVSFTSIGSAAALKFTHLKNHEEVFQELVTRFGLPDSEPLETFTPRVTFQGVLAHHIPTLLVLSLFPILGVVAAFFLHPALILVGIAGFLLGTVPTVVHELVHDPRCRLSFFEDHVMVRSGWINHKYTYVALHQARNIVTTAFPWQTTGKVQIEAGGAASRAVINHMDDLDALHDRLDALLYQRPLRDVTQTDTFDTEVLGEWQPVAKNDLITGCFVLVCTVVGILGIPLFVAYNRAYYARASCSLQVDRIAKRRGIFFRQHSTVLINRIDQIQTSREFLHNRLKNGMVQIFTVGSGKAELVLGPHANYQAIYEAIEARTR